ncbi:MAG: zf-TFIIB domain-containing protein [Burkholderiales bacterium]
MSASQFPPLEGKPSGKHCTNCSSKMTAYVLPGHYDAKVEIDVCMDCNAIWFDQFESMALSPDGTVALFQLIHQRGGTATSAAAKFSEGLRCVTCGEGMQLTNDQVKGTRFAYQACRKGHGRLTTFYNFLAEKQFVRELTKAERAKLAAKVEQIRCSGCGAAINIGKVDACEYCRAPVSVFDREAAKKAIDHYLLERQRQPAAGAGDRRNTGRSAGDQWSAYDRADLGTDILFALGRAAMRGVSGAGRAVPVGAAAGTSGAALGGGGGTAFTELPDATSALFGADALSNAGAAVSSGALSSLASGAAEGVSGALPSATDALFGTVSSGAGDAASGLTNEFASVLGDVASSGVMDVASGIGSSAIESVSDGALDVAGDVASEVASDMASSAGEGVVDLVTDGIGSLLGALFS